MSQLALVYESLAPNAKQSVQSVPAPEPGAGQVQVRIEAAAVNPVDQKAFDHGEFVNVLPSVLGSDGAGVVTRVAPGVTDVQVGDRVFFQGRYNTPAGAGATFQQLAVADAALLSRIPASVGFDEAATIPVAAVAAAAELYDLGVGLAAPWTAGGEGKYKGETIVVLGGSSSVGSYAIQLAALSGFRVVTTAAAKHTDYLRSLGAAAVVDREAGAAEVLAATGGPVGWVVDGVSVASTQLLGVAVLRDGGRLALVLSTRAATAAAAEAKGVRVASVFGSSHVYAAFFTGFWAAIGGYLERGVFRGNPVKALAGGLGAWEEAFALHRAGRVSGEKIVLRPQETQQV